MDHFVLHSDFKPTGDQPEAIKALVDGFKAGNQFETLLGVTGSGKTFTMANVIAALNKPTIVIAHNKTLAAQLYGEFKEFFPENAVMRRIYRERRKTLVQSMAVAGPGGPDRASVRMRFCRRGPDG